jgi:hypothetical protein
MTLLVVKKWNNEPVTVRQASEGASGFYRMTIKQMAAMIKKPQSLLYRWKKDKPELFEIVKLGCEAKAKK